MALGQALQSLKGVDHFQEVYPRIVRGPSFGYAADNKVAHPAAVKLWYEIVSVIAFGL